MGKICIIGHFGFGRELLNGQTIKTKIITAEIEKEFGKDDVISLDLAGGIKKIPSLMIKIPRLLPKSNHFVIMPVENGLMFLTPVLNFWNLVFKKKIHYVVIGGWLPEFLKERKWLLCGVKKFEAVYVETNVMKQALEQLGLNNVFVLPNCKKLEIVKEEDILYPDKMPYKLCTFSRVMKEKGIEDAVNAVMTINSERRSQVFELDIYGQIEESQGVWFEALQNTFPDYIRYRGRVPFEKSVEVLKAYFALLFPTYYVGEGFAGTLIDAYSAGVPVIASDWKYNTEIVNEKTGFVYPTGNQQAFVDLLRFAAENPSVVLAKRRQCIDEAAKYRIDVAVKVLLDQLGSE